MQPNAAVADLLLVRLEATPAPGPLVVVSPRVVPAARQIAVVHEVNCRIHRVRRPTHQVMRYETLHSALQNEDLARYTPESQHNLRSDPSARIYTPTKLLRLLR